MAEQRLNDEQYRELLGFRVALRRFLRWSSAQAADAGLTSQQHQLLLAIRGHAGRDAPTIGDLAEHLLLRHHSVVELIDRTEHGGFVERVVDNDDRRVVRLHLTASGRRVLDRLSAQHLEELARLAPIVGRLTRGLADDVSSAEHP
jgi:DNA-binding MarR family transcriptional regulator